MAKEARQDSEPLLAAVFESAIDAILIADDEGRYIRVNPAACNLLGLTEPELLGRRIGDFMAPDGDFEQAWRGFLDRGKDSGEMDLLRPDGTVVSVEYNAASHVVPGHHLSILRDVGRRRQAEEGLRILAEAGQLFAESLDFQQTLDNVARLAIPLLADWCVIDIVAENGSIERLVAVHADPEKQPLLDELKRHAPSLEDADGPAMVLRGGQPFLAPEITPEKLTSLARSEAHRQLILKLAPASVLSLPLIARGRQLGVWTFIRSAPGRPYRDGDLPLTETLARRASLAIDNARLYLAAENANRAKDQFLASLSHELRTPLTPVLALVSRLDRGPGTSPELRRGLAVIRKNIELEARLIDDLLDLTRIARGKIELHPEVTDIHALLQHAIQVCCAGEDGRIGVEVDLGAPDARVWADGPRLTQVFWNLLTNAIKFTPPGGAIRVRTSAAEAGGEGAPELVVEISDTGVGIEPELMPRIFGAFEQGRLGAPRRSGGLGLGLAISKAILELHGGSLAAASPGRDQGATFTVRIPFHRELLGPVASPLLGIGAAAAAETRPAEAADRPLRILLIEDHEDTAAALSDLLTDRGHSVQVAGTVRAGLETAARSAADLDLVISDLGLPDGSGVDLMREITARYGLPGIALSGYGMDEDIRRSLEAGFCLHLTKPVNVQVLEEAIRKCRMAAVLR
ncbi:MAG TPA: ATP-binding protein [Thermoanaerobaculia bacterium]|nr:ATP-binding protein [Thermoanaerobaculia bacterium]